MTTRFPAPWLSLPDIPLPLMARVRQHLPESSLDNVSATLARELAGLPLPTDLHGKRVALGVGSRGIGGLPALVREIVSFLRARNACPFIVPAMGSHGGATAEGQRDILTG